MSQEILFLIFMIVELCSILLLYQVIIIPKIAKKTNSLFEERMLNKSWNIPAMLEDYTEHLTVVFSEIIKTLVPQVVGGFMSAGNKQLRADPENAPQIAVADFLESLDPPARMVANMVLPRIQEALLKGKTSPKEAVVEYSPGLNKR
jgi:hypothetical protein